MLSEEEIEKAKERLVKQAVTSNVDCEYYPNCICMKKDLIIVLNYIEQLEQENKQYREFIFTTNGKDIENITATKYVQIRREGYIEGKIEEQNKSIKHINNLNKMIDEMVEYLAQDIRCIRSEIECNKMTHDCRDCVKKYFEEKVEGELNAKN